MRNDARKFKQLSLLLGVFLLIASLGACEAITTVSSSGPGGSRKSEIGEVFIDLLGRSLYTYDADSPKKSNCIGMCPFIWPPVIADDEALSARGFTIITRDTGAKQWAYRGKPLYGYVFDLDPGDTKGDGIDGEWHVARP